jgi:hypothetical protein
VSRPQGSSDAESTEGAWRLLRSEGREAMTDVIMIQTSHLVATSFPARIVVAACQDLFPNFPLATIPNIKSRPKLMLTGCDLHHMLPDTNFNSLYLWIC